MKFLFVNGPPIIKYGLAAGLKEAGEQVEIIEVPTHLPSNPNYFKEHLKRYRPNFIVVEGTAILKPYQVLFPLLKEMNLTMIYWAIDDPIEFNNFSLHLARRARYVFTPAVECLSRYHAHQINAHYLQFACLPSFHRRIAPDSRYNHDLVLIANNYKKYTPRQEGIEIILRPLLNDKYNLKVYGNKWWLDPQRPFNLDEKFYGGYLPYEELPAVYSTGRIALSLHSVNTSPTMMSMRTFEVLGCGAFYLTQWTPSMENLFKNHVHLVWSKSAEETRELVDFYLKNPELREKIARQGQAEVYARHTYLQRAKDLLAVIKN